MLLLVRECRDTGSGFKFLFLSLCTLNGKRKLLGTTVSVKRALFSVDLVFKRFREFVWVLRATTTQPRSRKSHLHHRTEAVLLWVAVSQRMFQQ